MPILILSTAALSLCGSSPLHAEPMPGASESLIAMPIGRFQQGEQPTEVVAMLL